MKQYSGWIVAGILFLIMISWSIYTFGYSVGQTDLIIETSESGKIYYFESKTEGNETIMTNKKLETTINQIIAQGQQQGYQNGYNQCVEDVKQSN